MPESLYGRNANRQQGTQRPTTGKSAPASSYGRSSQRAAPTGNTSFNASEDRADKAARDKKHGHGKWSRQRLFP